MFEYSLHLAAMRICEWFRWLNAMCGASGNDGLGEPGRGALGAWPGYEPPILTFIRHRSCYGGRAGDVRCALGWNEEERSPGPGSTAGLCSPALAPRSSAQQWL